MYSKNVFHRIQKRPDLHIVHATRVYYTYRMSYTGWLDAWNGTLYDGHMWTYERYLRWIMHYTYTTYNINNNNKNKNENEREKKGEFFKP